MFGADGVRNGECLFYTDPLVEGFQGAGRGHCMEETSGASDRELSWHTETCGASGRQEGAEDGHTLLSLLQVSAGRSSWRLVDDIAAAHTWQARS